MEYQRKRKRIVKMAKRIKKNTELLIDGENIGAKKAGRIMNAALTQGVVYESKVYGRQKDERTKRWSDKARECGMADIRLFGKPEKNKVDNKIKKDARKVVAMHKNVDVVCIATNDGGFVDVIKELRSQGKRVVVIGESQAPEKLRKSCSEFIEI